MKEYWVYTSNFFPLWAGPSERFHRYAKISEQYGLKLLFHTFDRGVEAHHEKYEGVDVYRYKTSSIAELADMVVAKAKESQRKPDAVLVIPLDRTTVKFNSEMQKLGVKTIYVSTMDFDLETRENGVKRGFLRRYLYKQYLKRIINSFDITVSSSTYLSNNYHLKLGVASSKLAVVPNGVNTKVFSPEPDKVPSLRQELGLPKDQVVFLFVGLMVERKGIIDLLKAWKLFKDNGGTGFLACVGDEKRYDGDEEFYNEYLQLRTGLEKKEADIRFFGPSKRVADFFKASDSFVFMSKLEGMPNVLLEAMSTEVPIILNPFKGFSDDYGVTGEHFIKVDAQNTDSVAETLKIMSENEELRQEIGKKSRKRILDHFQVENSIKKYADLTE